ncbi:bifunctional YncE family protein/alkaline phosphatase family protein [Flavobacterium gilvum]|uniref:YNCE-like beta-propeller domain-containing protein n=1 Tax=Flavobacterium gilvum TaxID=1492737 RepID=A0AAC9N7E0_9FLAO|nr:bifunctional YncE family protein/alkaline phosphatase family protein [Flavobacterium gilvum]AOW10273.1 hypothetical protein EM308_12585 [Flavobacterium gilvum]KFC59482.1 hypothetical protein FEM08_17260 [Flavobacterium gilvum]
MVNRFSILAFISLFCSFGLLAQSHSQKETKTVLLPNGWSITNVGRSLPLGDLPLNIAVSTSKKRIAVTNNGLGKHYIQLIDTKSERQIDSIIIPSSWYGLKFSSNDKKLYASGGNDNVILRYDLIGNKLKLNDTITLGKKWPNRISPAGFDIDEKNQLLYVVTKDNNSLYVVDLKTKKIKKQLPLGGEGFTCVLSPDLKELYVSCWGCEKLLIYDTAKEEFAASIGVGSHPNEILLTKKGDFIFVANSNDNSVSVIERKTRKVVETLNAALYPDAPAGSTTNSLAFSGNEKQLYIANADNNCLAVFDVSQPGKSKSLGFVPTGWYPTNVKIVNKKIFVTNAKGFVPLTNFQAPTPYTQGYDLKYRQEDASKPKSVHSIGELFKGALSIIDQPSKDLLAAYTKMVYQNSPYSKEKELKAHNDVGNPVPMKVGDVSPIKYVFYVIKENRTYDQVMGDVKEGNGDPSLVMFGEKVTPNQHKLAKDFVLLDNFYVDAEVSADGHAWTLGAYATDYLEKMWPTCYGRAWDYPGEGRRAIANNKAGYIWDACKRANISYRSYGEFIIAKKPTISVLQNNYCKTFNSWDELAEKDVNRFEQWKKDFDSLVAIKKVPQFNTVRFPNDHTEGLRKGRPTPNAHVADNDLATGLLVEYLSKSPIWNECLVLIVEDDAQSGTDHVDAHRSTAFLAGPYVKRNFVDHTMYSSTSFLRTIELILGLAPLSQHDAGSTPLWNSFTHVPDFSPFKSVPSNIDLKEVNVAMNKWQQKSETFDFSKVDAVPDLEFTELLWHAIKGDAVAFPGPRRAAFVRLSERKDDDD